MSEPNNRVQELLDEVFYPGAHAAWLDKPRLVWGGKTAKQMIDNDHAVAVENYLDNLAEGNFS